MAELTKKELHYLMLEIEEPLQVTFVNLKNKLDEAEQETEDIQEYLTIEEELSPQLRFIETLIKKLTNE